MWEYAIKNKINTLRRWNHVSPTMISTAPSGIVVHNGMHEWHNTFSNACASYLSWVFGGIEKIKWWDSRILISSADTISYNVSVISFKALWALWTGLTCPFDKRANGFMPSEWAYSMLLEKEAEALARGKKPIMQIAWYAESSDATIRITDPEINRQAEAMLKALHMAWIQPEDIDGVVTHGTSTQAGDPSEATAIHAVFWNHKPTIMAPKSSCGHNIWTASALWIQCAETAFKYWIGPAILNLEDPIPAAEWLELATGKKRKFKYIMVNSFWFGGYNACLILKKYEQKK
jgi:3-oxoacyl-(acyl-carrier-protein) synthase